MPSTYAQSHFHNINRSSVNDTASTASTSHRSFTRYIHRRHDHQHAANSHTEKSPMTRENVLAMARNEYARQLCEFTEAQLKKQVTSCKSNDNCHAS
ncbi:hypothetical protein BX666DRAFT_1853598 [Dichotomocladium elegans]|nr:hypothetical protein BX666DRAFT_1853598 [Dichotomocladium elegans]